MVSLHSGNFFGFDLHVPLWASSLIATGLTLLAGIFAGLILCVFSLDVGRLTGITQGSNAGEAAKAKRILRILEKPHWLLITLLVWDDIALEMLPLMLNMIFSNPVAAVISSVIITLFFCEIIPQAVFIHNAFEVSAFFATFLYALMLVTSPIAWPLGKLLDHIVGDKEAVFFQRRELRELIRYQEELLERDIRTAIGDTTDAPVDEEDREDDITKEELIIMLNVLGLSESTARDMLPNSIESMYRLHIDDVLTESVAHTIFTKGYPFVLIYENKADDTNVTLVLMAKFLTLLIYQDTEVKVSDLPLLPLTRFKGNTIGSKIFTALQDLSPAIAVITDEKNDSKVLGVITLRAVIDQVHETSFKAEMDPNNESPMQLIVRSWKMYQRSTAYTLQVNSRPTSLNASFRVMTALPVSPGELPLDRRLSIISSSPSTPRAGVATAKR